LSSKWAKSLSSQCEVDPATLQLVLEELSESCYGDARTAKKVIEELTLKCHFNEDDLKRFKTEVSKNCPVDAKKLHQEVIQAEGEKEHAFQAIDRAARRPL